MEVSNQTVGSSYVYTITFPLAYQKECSFITLTGNWIGGSAERYSVQSKTKTGSEFGLYNAGGNLHNIDWLSFGT